MKISNIFANVQKRINVSRILKREADINKYVGLHDSGRLPDGVLEQLETSREIIANFARKNSVKVDIYNARVHQQRLASGGISNSGNGFLGNLEVVVSNLKNGIVKRAFVSSNTKELHPKVKQTNIIVPIRDAGIERLWKAQYYTEDNFLRNLYRNIEELTKSVKSNSSR